MITADPLQSNHSSVITDERAGPIMTTVLMGYATTMGATREIAVAMGDVLRANGLQVTIADTEDLHDLGGWDAVVIGSAVYMSHWRSSAMALLERQAEEPVRIPIWLFQSGPFEPVPAGSSVGTPGKVARLARRLGASGPDHLRGQDRAGHCTGIPRPPNGGR